MLLNNYVVQIPQGKEDRQGYVGLQHKQKYQFYLENIHETRCNISITIDGKNQGTWRLKAFARAILEHPAHDKGCFTFYKLDSQEAQKIQLEDNSELGLIEVVFIPEKQYPVRNNPEVLESYGSQFRSSKSQNSYSSDRARGCGQSAGGTGLSGWSQQDYGQAAEMPLDLTKTTTIYLRLVCIDDNTQDEPRSLTSYSSPIPPRI